MGSSAVHITLFNKHTELQGSKQNSTELRAIDLLMLTTGSSGEQHMLLYNRVILGQEP